MSLGPHGRGGSCYAICMKYAPDAIDALGRRGLAGHEATSARTVAGTFRRRSDSASGHSIRDIEVLRAIGDAIESHRCCQSPFAIQVGSFRFPKLYSQRGSQSDRRIRGLSSRGTPLDCSKRHPQHNDDTSCRLCNPCHYIARIVQMPRQGGPRTPGSPSPTASP